MRIVVILSFAVVHRTQLEKKRGIVGQKGGKRSEGRGRCLEKWRGTVGRVGKRGSIGHGTAVWRGRVHGSERVGWPPPARTGNCCRY